MEALRSEWSLKAIAVIVTASILLRCDAAAATNHSVGGVSGWDLSSNLQAWTSETTFHVGDSLVFSYTPVHDVIEVHRNGYESCDASSPITTHNDGETVVPLGQQGARYFICGHQGHCRMGLKLEVKVLKQPGRPGKDGPVRPAGPPVEGSASAPTPQLRNSGVEKPVEVCFFHMLPLVTVVSLLVAS